jgi:hypothetical protein
MKDFQSEYSIYHEDMHENTGEFSASFGVLGSIQSARDGKSAYRIGEHSWSLEDWRQSFVIFPFKPCPRSLLQGVTMVGECIRHSSHTKKAILLAYAPLNFCSLGLCQQKGH